MSRRFLELIAVAAVFVVVVVLLKLATMPVGGQTPAAAEKAGPAPNTPPIGVEIGQACIVVVVATLLAAVRNRSQQSG